MLYMVIERFKDNDMVPIYERLRKESRKLPEGLRYIDTLVTVQATPRARQ